MPSASSRGTSRWRSRSSSSSAVRVEALGLGGERRRPRRRARGPPRCRRRCLPLVVGAHDRGQRRVPLVERARPRRVGEDVRRGRAAARGRRARRPDRRLLRTSLILRCGLGTRVHSSCTQTTTPARSHDGEGPASREATWRPSWRTASRSGRRGHRCRGSSACRCRTGGSSSTRRRECGRSVDVLRVVNVLPQVQVTWVSTYAGWMSFFMVVLRLMVAGSSARVRET